VSEDPSDELRHEHEAVLVVVAAMEREVDAVRAGRPIDGDAVAKMVDFTRNFTDGCHHTKEEKVLFPLMEERSQAAGGPVSVMLSEHEAGRAAVRAIADNLPAAGRDEAARTAVVDNLAAYSDLLRMHIHKENEVLFPLAGQIFGEDDRRHVASEFARVEKEETGAGVHERYHQMAHELAETRTHDE
jgi:hemerythrin-like domain-containing protein